MIGLFVVPEKPSAAWGWWMGKVCEIERDFIGIVLLAKERGDERWNELFYTKKESVITFSDEASARQLFEMKKAGN